jgi:hypothetical protein
MWWEVEWKDLLLDEAKTETRETLTTLWRSLLVGSDYYFS